MQEGSALARRLLLLAGRRETSTPLSCLRGVAAAGQNAGAMHLTALDWWIVALSLGVTFLPALLLAHRSGKSTTEFFAAGRMAPWWLIGISLVATTFSTDTPNLVTNFVREGGVAANWQWWAFLLTGMATVFFYARMWRRSAVLTDLEFYELRYSGKAASLVRGFRAVYLGLLFNCVIIATVNLAAVKIAAVLFGWPEGETLAFCAGVPILFAAIGGLWGVMVTDLIQFCITMTSAFAAAYFALTRPQVGGLHGLIVQIHAQYPHALSLLPNFSDWKTAVAIFVIPIAVQWWSVWYPGAEPGGGSYVAQRMLAARSERDAMTGTMLFQVMNYALRPWPWILVALASMLVFPTLHSIHAQFPNVPPNLIGDDIAYPAMLTFLPAGFAGFMVAGLFAAYRSTLETHLNWGTSYLVHDFYQRFIRRDASERHYVLVGRLVTALIMFVAIGMTYLINTASDGFQLLLSIGAGTGLLYLLRWFWARVNAWSEISAMLASLLMALGVFLAKQLGHPLDAMLTLPIEVAVTSIVWITVTLLTKPSDDATLARFYERVRPFGPGWRAVRERLGLPPSIGSPAADLAGWFLGLAFVYGALFGTGAWLYGNMIGGLFALLVVLGSGLGLLRLGARLWGPPKPTLSTESTE